MSNENLHRYVGTQWKHKVRGTTYYIAGVGRLNCENPDLDEQPTFAYVPTNDRSKMEFRPVSEFLDGRFVKIGEPVPSEVIEG